MPKKANNNKTKNPQTIQEIKQRNTYIYGHDWGKGYLKGKRKPR